MPHYARDLEQRGTPEDRTERQPDGPTGRRSAPRTRQKAQEDRAARQKAQEDREAARGHKKTERQPERRTATDCRTAPIAPAACPCCQPADISRGAPSPVWGGRAPPRVDRTAALCGDHSQRPPGVGGAWRDLRKFPGISRKPSAGVFYVSIFERTVLENGTTDSECRRPTPIRTSTHFRLVGIPYYFVFGEFLWILR